jgi:tetratricopeptide (TPR) repeat protein
MNTKRFFLVPFLFLLLLFSGFTQDIDPSRNAIWHNSLGMEYMKQGDYAAAISEYKIAIALKADTSASAAFHNNLGLVYMKLNKPNWAIVCFENAIQLNSNAFYFYENLVDAYAKANVLGTYNSYFKRKTSANFENSYNWLMLGLIQTKRKEYKNAINSFNNYVLLEPEIVVSQAVKTKINELRRFAP